MAQHTDTACYAKGCHLCGKKAARDISYPCPQCNRQRCPLCWVCYLYAVCGIDRPVRLET